MARRTEARLTVTMNIIIKQHAAKLTKSVLTSSEHSGQVVR